MTTDNTPEPNPSGYTAGADWLLRNSIEHVRVFGGDGSIIRETSADRDAIFIAISDGRGYMRIGLAPEQWRRFIAEQN